MSLIMSIEDEPNISRLIKVVLERSGHTVLVANTIADARTMLASIPATPPDLIICDGNVQTKTGHDGALYAVELVAAGYTVCMLSTFDYSEWGLRSYFKPFTKEQLHQLVAEMLP